jgi:DNA-binding CsgD family transcriptional regulator
MEPLQVLGLDDAALRAYVELVTHGEATRERLAARIGVEPAHLDVLIGDLRRLGLVMPGPAEAYPGRLIPAPPHLAMEALAQQRTREAALVRDGSAMLSQLWSRGAGQHTFFELLPSPEAARAVLDRVQVDAREQVRAMTVGNLTMQNTTIVDGLFEALARGVRYQVIYGTRVLQDTAALRMVELCADAGEQARVMPEVPMNLTVVDDRWALLASRSSVAGRNQVAALVVHESPVLAGLIGVFEVFWRMAVPITGEDVTGSPLTPETRRLLSYLTAGLTDESIARELGVSERTVARRISRLQQTLGAQTRFQLGVQASRRRWL